MKTRTFMLVSALFAVLGVSLGVSIGYIVSSQTVTMTEYVESSVHVSVNAVVSGTCTYDGGGAYVSMTNVTYIKPVNMTGHKIVTIETVYTNVVTTTTSTIIVSTTTNNLTSNTSAGCDTTVL